MLLIRIFYSTSRFNPVTIHHTELDSGVQIDVKDETYGRRAGVEQPIMPARTAASGTFESEAGFTHEQKYLFRCVSGS